MRKIRVGVIGVGIQGSQHLKAYKSHPLVYLVAAADIDASKLEKVKAEYGVQQVYLDYKEMIDKAELDLVSVVTPDFAHFEPVTYALRSGVNVIVEKPLATDPHQAEEMVRLARSRGLMLYVNFGNRWNPPFTVAKQKVVSGELGEPVYSYFRLSDTVYVPYKMLSWASKTNVVYFLMTHTADLAAWIFDDKPIEVYAVASKKVLKAGGVDTYDYVTAIVEFSRGGRAVLESSWILAESLPSIVDFRAEILCSKGTIFIENFGQGIEVGGERFEYPRYSGGYVLNNRYVGFVRESIHHAVDSLLAGEEPLVKPEEALVNVKLLDAVIRSAETGQKVKIT